MDVIYRPISKSIENIYDIVGKAFNIFESINGEYVIEQNAEFAAKQDISKQIYTKAMEMANEDGFDEINYEYLSSAKLSIQMEESEKKSQGIYTKTYNDVICADVFAIYNAVKKGLIKLDKPEETKKTDAKSYLDPVTEQYSSSMAKA